MVSEAEMPSEAHASGRWSEQTSIELLARASELRRMAKTATTDADIKALERLADRFAALAKRRTVI